MYVCGVGLEVGRRWCGPFIIIDLLKRSPSSLQFP